MKVGGIERRVQLCAATTAADWIKEDHLDEKNYIAIT
jgi:uncharacterized membrane protein